jgi:hypothetical protein
MAGQVEARRRPLEARSWAARGGRMRRDSVAAQLGSAATGWDRELTGGAHASAKGEREKASNMKGVNQRRKCILWNTTKARAGQAGRRRERWPAEDAGQHGEG